MLPMGLLFILATAAPQTNAKPQTAQGFTVKTNAAQSNTCYTMRSYRFHQNAGLAPVPAGMTTCTPANMMQQRQVSRDQNSLFVPLAINNAEKPVEAKAGQAEAKPEQKDKR